MTNLFQLKIRHFLFNFEQEVPYFFYSPEAAQGSPPQKAFAATEINDIEEKSQFLKRCLVQELAKLLYRLFLVASRIFQAIFLPIFY